MADKCSFCDKQKPEIKVLIAGKNGDYICERCVAKFGKVMKMLPDDMTVVTYQPDINIEQPGPPPRTA